MGENVKIRDRIKSLRRVKASDLIANPRNWRTHPQEQQDALRGVLADVGYADALLVREAPEGLMLIDGHLRAGLDPEAKVPVLVLDVTAEEADKIMLTLDPLAAMAEADQQRLGELLHDVQVESEAVQALLDGLAEQNGIDVFEDAAGETPAESIALLVQTNALFYVHSNDNTGDGGDWDMVSGSVHFWQYLEALYTLDRLGYDGWIGADIKCPLMDAVDAFAANTLMLRRMMSLLDQLDAQRMADLVAGEGNTRAVFGYLMDQMVPDKNEGPMGR